VSPDRIDAARHFHPQDYALVYYRQKGNISVQVKLFFMRKNLLTKTGDAVATPSPGRARNMFPPTAFIHSTVVDASAPAEQGSIEHQRFPKQRRRLFDVEILSWSVSQAPTKV